MKKRGISDIVSTVLIILIVVVAVAVIGITVSKITSNLSESIEMGTSQIALSVLHKTVFAAEGHGGQYVYFSVQRNPGEGELTGIKAVVYDNNGQSFSQQIDEGMGVFESKTMGFNLPASFGKISKINVYPISKTTKGKEFIGNAPAVYTYSYPNLATTPITTPDGGTITSVNGENVYVPSGLIRYYKFDDNTEDSTGGPAGTLNGVIPPTYVSGKVGKSINFSGVYKQYVNISDAGTNTLDLQTISFTISFWHKPSSMNGVQQIFVKGVNDGVNWPSNLMYSWIHTNSPYGRIAIINMGFGESISKKDISPAPLQTSSMLNNWNHVTLTMNRSSKTFSYYYNGIFNSSVTDASLSSSHPSINGRFTIGGQVYANGAAYFNYSGAVDEFRVYNYSMSDSQVKALYDSYS